MFYLKFIFLILIVLNYVNCKCFPIKGVSPNIILECGNDAIVSFRGLNGQLYRYESSVDDNNHFFYPRPYENKLYDQSINGGPLITFDMEIQSMNHPVPNEGGDIKFRGVFFFDGKKIIKPVQVFIYSRDQGGKVIFDQIIRAKHLSKSNFEITIPKGCGSDISIINPYNNKILFKTNYALPCSSTTTTTTIDDKINNTSPALISTTMTYNLDDDNNSGNSNSNSYSNSNEN